MDPIATIDEFKRRVPFAVYGDIAEEDVLAVEEGLGVRLPPVYRYFIKTCGVAVANQFILEYFPEQKEGYDFELSLLGYTRPFRRRLGQTMNDVDMALPDGVKLENIREQLDRIVAISFDAESGTQFFIADEADENPTLYYFNERDGEISVSEFVSRLNDSWIVMDIWLRRSNVDVCEDRYLRYHQR